MKHLIITFLCLLCFSLLHAHNHVLPPGFALEEQYITGLDKPTDLKVAPDGRIFITEKSGHIRIVENGVLLPQPFYTVLTQVPNERGLDGIILDPDFDQNGYVYIYYTLPFENKNIVARITAAGNTAVPNSEVELMRFDPMWASWHNGGGMAFDSTGCLIIGIGDGTAGAFAQGMGKTLGKIMRIHTDGSIPTDNPFFAQNTGIHRGIAAYGVRNPYTMAASKLSGRIFFNDVGNDAFEEVNEYLVGKNYGWDEVEGMLGMAAPPDANYTDPIHVYDHTFGCAIVGASFYEPDISLFPTDYYGKYFFMEYCEGKIMCMDPDDFTVTVFGSGLENGYNNLETSPDGYIYMINIADGNLARLSYQGINAPPLISVEPAAQTAAVGENVLFSVEATGDTLSYEWYIDGNLFYSGLKEFIILPAVQLSDDQAQIHVRVANPHGGVLSDTVRLTVVAGTRPAIQFNGIPATYAAGDTIPFAATVSDPDQAAVPASDWTWRIDFHHDAHTHPALSPISGTGSGIYVVETFGEVDTNVHYRVHLSVLDSSGLSGAAFVDVLPRKVTLHLQSTPAGVPVSIDGKADTTGVALRSVENLNRTLDVAPYAFISDSLYAFQAWWDGEDTLTRVFAATDDTLRVDYDALRAWYPAAPDTGTLTVFKDTASAQTLYRSRPVTEIKENWDIRSPYPWDNPAFPTDYWSARWEGNIYAPVSDDYTFYLFHDGKVSLTVGDSLLLDGVVSSGSLQEDTAQIWLNGGDSLVLRVDYDHFTYLARVELDWEYSVVERQTVPFSVRRPPEPVVEPPEEFEKSTSGIFLFPNPTDADQVHLCLDYGTFRDEFWTLRVFDHLGRLLTEANGQVLQEIISLPATEYAEGLYLFRLTVGNSKKTLKFLKR